MEEDSNTGKMDGQEKDQTQAREQLPSSNENIEQPVADVIPPVENGESSGHKKFPVNPKWLAVIGAILVILIVAVLVGLLVSQKGQVQETGSEIVYWGLWDDDMIQPLIDEYRQKSGVVIVYQEQSPQDYRERLQNSLERGSGPDIFGFHNTWVPMLSRQFSALPEEMMGEEQYKDTFYPVASSSLRRGMDIVGIPLVYDGLGLFINEGIFAASGKTPPRTWNELREAARELTRVGANREITTSGVSLGDTSNVDHWQDIVSLLLLQNKADLANPVSNLASDALVFFTVFSEQDNVWDKTLPTSTVAFSQGNLAMYFGPSWRAFEIKKMNPSLNFHVVQVPQQTRTLGEDIAWASFWAEGVWSGGVSQKAAWEFLKFLSSRESLVKLYENSEMQGFGFVAARQDMQDLFINHPYLGAYAKDAQFAKTWYLTSQTHDGAKGINSRIATSYKTAIDSIIARGKMSEILEGLAENISQILASY